MEVRIDYWTTTHSGTETSPSYTTQEGANMHGYGRHIMEAELMNDDNYVIACTVGSKRELLASNSQQYTIN